MEHSIENKKTSKHRAAGPSNNEEPQVRSQPRHPLLQLQQQAGNQAVQQVLRQAARPKVAASQPLAEGREADSIPDGNARSQAGTIPGKLAETERSLASDQTITDSLSSSGQPLEATTRSLFEPRFGRDFSKVRVHTGPEATRSAQDMNALAYTVGHNIVFGSGQYAPSTPGGQGLLAHELAHVVQQERSAPPESERLQRLPGEDSLEREAQQTARLATGGQQEALPTLSALPVQRAQCQNAGTLTPVARPTLTEMRTIAQGYIGDYFSAARAGLTDFEHDVASGFDWGSFWVTVGGNVIWAAASFATGGTAFVISLAGIAVSTAAAANAVTSAPDFHSAAVHELNDMVTNLNNQVNRVTHDVDAAAFAGNWDDNRTRRELLQRLVKPEYISTATGGLPNLSQPNVAASVREELLVRAAGQRTTNHWHMGPAVYQGYFEEDWKIDNAIEYIQYPFSPTMPVLKDQSQWFYGLTSARFENVSPQVPGVNAKMNDIYRTYGRRIDPSVWAIEKRIVLNFDQTFYVTYYLDASNNLTRVDAPMFSGLVPNPDAYLRNLLRMIQGHAGAVPRTSALSP